MKAVGRPQKWTKMWRSGRKYVGARYLISCWCSIHMIIWLLQKSLRSDPVDGVKSTTFERFSHHIKAQQMYSFQKVKGIDSPPQVCSLTTIFARSIASEDLYLQKNSFPWFNFIMSYLPFTKISQTKCYKQSDTVSKMEHTNWHIFVYEK